MGMTYSELNAGVSFNVVGLALGCLFFIPLTKKYGRRSTYVFSTGIMAVTSWWSSRMNSVVEMYLTNLFFGLAGSMNETIAEMTVSLFESWIDAALANHNDLKIADLFFVHQRGLANGFYITAATIGNFLAPTLAGVQAASMGWRWSYYTVGIILSILFVLFIFFFEETKYIPVVVGHADGQQLKDGSTLKPFKSDTDDKTPVLDPSAYSKQTDVEIGVESSPPLNSYRQRMRFLTTTEESLWTGYITPVKTAILPHVLFTAIECANCVVSLVLFTSLNSIVFSAPPYSFSTAGVGLMLVGPFIGNLIGSLYGGLLGDWIVGMHWIYPSIGGACFAFGSGSMMDVSFTVVIDTYKEITAESFVFITFIRNAATIGVPFAIVPWMNSMSLTSISAISGSIASVVCFLYIPLLIWGRQIRVALHARYDRLAMEAGQTGLLTAIRA
ncbi:major facilitator superfamily transporter [Colletotrichum tofieldiae]|nr:major facilitator superfamily transporter [Colletotrichum tofieldiae]